MNASASLADSLRHEANLFHIARRTAHAELLEHAATILDRPREQSTGSAETDRRVESETKGLIGSRPTAENACVGQEAPRPHMVVEHQGNLLNSHISIEGRNPGPGGAFTQYVLLLKPNTEQPASRMMIVEFQSKPIQTPDDFNGFTNEALLAIVIDRLRGFQQGPFSCRENSAALTKADECMHWLQARSRERGIRGVEGQLRR